MPKIEWKIMKNFIGNPQLNLRGEIVTYGYVKSKSGPFNKDREMARRKRQMERT